MRPQLAGAGTAGPRELVDEFKTMLDDRRVVSANLLREEDIRILSLDGRAIVVIQVPPAPRDQLPVYIGGDPVRGCYRRSGDGDYHCTPAERNAMLSERFH